MKLAFTGISHTYYPLIMAHFEYKTIALNRYFYSLNNGLLIIPPSILSDLKGISGFDEQSFIAAHAMPAPVSVRLHPAKGKHLYPDYLDVPWCSNGIYLPERPVFTLDPSFHAGAYYVQEASSMFLEQMLKHTIDGRKGLRVLDLCAAPGGKSTLAASMLDETSLLVSNEVIRSRASILEENMSRWGYMNTWVISNDPRDVGKLAGYFDVIIVDAPCSGSGLWRKDPKALNEWSEANVDMCAARQQRILADIWPALKTGGALIYATCSYSPREDEDILDQMADEYELGSVSVPLDAAWEIEHVRSPRNGISGYRFFPGNVAGEGFFIAAMIKGEASGDMKAQTGKLMRDKKAQEMAARFFAEDNVLITAGKDGNFNAIRQEHEADLLLLQKAVYLRKTGIAAGMPTAKEWLPAHDIALSINRAADIPAIDTNREQALRFLKRDDMGIEGIDKGWHLVRYGGEGLGWVKALGNRMNNYLPKHWRIRMEIDEI